MKENITIGKPEYIILTKPAEKEDKNTIKLMNGQILQAGLRKDIEHLDDYISYLECDLKSIEVNGKHLFGTHYYFVEGGIRIRYYWKELSPEFRELRPIPNIEGSMNHHTRAIDILYQFDKKLKEQFPEAEYELIVKHNACCLLQPRIAFKTDCIKSIKGIFPEFKLEKKIDETEYGLSIIPPGLKYKEDYSEHDGYYDCRRCDPDPCWGRYVEEKPKQDLNDEFCEQKVPHRKKGNPRAHCFGTRTKEKQEGNFTVELGYWKLTLEELLSRIEKPKEEDIPEILIEERRMRVLTGKVKISLDDKPIDFYELIDPADTEPYKKLIELEEKGLIKGYHPNNE